MCYMIVSTPERLDELKRYCGLITIEGEEQDEIVLRMKFDQPTAERVHKELCAIESPLTRAERRKYERETEYWAEKREEVE